MAPEAHEAMMAIEQGIPRYMRAQVVAWILDNCRTEPFKEFDKDFPEFLSLQFKIIFPRIEATFAQHLGALDDATLVSVIDWMLFHQVYKSVQKASSLKGILDLGRSEWTVSDIEAGAPRMSRRIPSGVEAAYRDVVAKTGKAGSLLAQSFNAAYGAQPNSDSAYGLCVKAVETLACPKFLPLNTRATLGSVISHLSGKDVSLPLLAGNTSDKELIIDMMRKLWAGGERHGSETYQHVSLPGAKTALTLAFSLVSMLHEDVITVS